MNEWGYSVVCLFVVVLYYVVLQVVKECKGSGGYLYICVYETIIVLFLNAGQTR